MKHSTYIPDSPNLVYYALQFTPFLVGVIAGIKIKLGGELFLGEFLAMLYFFIRLHGARLTAAERWFAVFAILWSLAQLLSDIVNHTAPLDSVKGVLAPLFFAFATLGLIIYFRKNIARMPSFLIGVTVAAAINLVVLPTEYFLSDNKWKWGIGGIALTAALIYYSFFLKNKSKYLLAVGLIIFLLISLYNNARSMAILPLLAGIAYHVFAVRRLSFARYFRGRWALLRTLAVALPFLILLNFSFSSLFSSEIVLQFLPEEAAQKYRLQASNPYGMLLAGRSEILVSAQAFIDKPFLGHGSWAIDNGTYALNYMQLRYLYGIDEDLLPVEGLDHRSGQNPVT
jgi:hypothetical protein